MEKAVMEMAKELVTRNEDFVVARIVDTAGSTPRKKGACLLMRRDGSCVGSVGGGVLDAEAERIALSLFESKQNFVQQLKLTADEREGLDMRCGGDVTVSFEYMDKRGAESFLKEFEKEDIVYIFGGGHVGMALETIIRSVGFETVIIDDRVEFANRERFPKAKHVYSINNYENALTELTVDKNAYIVIVTRGHLGDLEVLKQAVEKEYAYVGMIGSRKKIAETFDLLRHMGTLEEKIEKVHAPIGLSIHAETPEEIAISIVAEIIQVRWLQKQNESH